MGGQETQVSQKVATASHLMSFHFISLEIAQKNPPYAARSREDLAAAKYQTFSKPN